MFSMITMNKPKNTCYRSNCVFCYKVFITNEVLALISGPLKWADSYFSSCGSASDKNSYKCMAHNYTFGVFNWKQILALTHKYKTVLI